MCQLIHIIEINALKCSQHQLSSGQSCKANQHLSSAKLYLPSVSAWFWIEQNISKNAHGLYGSFATHTAWKTSKQLNTQVLELNKLWTWKTDLQFECELGNRLGSCLFGKVQFLIQIWDPPNLHTSPVSLIHSGPPEVFWRGALYSEGWQLCAPSSHSLSLQPLHQIYQQSYRYRPPLLL